MFNLLCKLLIIGIVIILITLYLYNYNKNINNFENIIQTSSHKPYSTLLHEQISLKLNISKRRLVNVNYTGNLDTNLDTKLLNVSFTVLDPNITELQNGEQNLQTVINNANSLFNTNMFTVKINNNNVMLNKINNKTSNIKSVIDNSIYFNNTGIRDMATYSNNKYISVPNDKLLTQFYELKYDNKFNLKPILN